MADSRGRRGGTWAVRLAALPMLAAGPAWGQPAPPARPPDPLGALALLLLIPLAIGVFTALEVVLWILAPGPLIATGRAVQRGRGRCLLTGVAAAIGVLALLTLCSHDPATGKTAAPLLVGIFGLGCLTGISAMAELLGQGAIELAGRSGSRAVTVGVGAVLFGLMVLFPLAGQVLGVYFALVGLGGALRAMVHSAQGRK